MTILKTLAAILIFELIGFLTLRFTAGKKSNQTLPQLLSLAFGVGVGVLGFGMFYLAYWRIPLDELRIFALVGCLLLGLIILNLLSSRRISFGSGLRRLTHAHDFFSAGEVTLLGLISLFILLVIGDALSQPLLSFDARAILSPRFYILNKESTMRISSIQTDSMPRPAIHCWFL